MTLPRPHLRLPARPLLAPSAALLLLLPLLLAACGGGSSPSSSNSPQPGTGAVATQSSNAAAPSGGSATVNATANDFNFKFNTTSVAAGPVHFTLTNQSKTYQHELVVYPQNQPKLQAMITALDAGQTVNLTDYLQGIAANIPPQDPGKSASADATLQPGTYDMACFVVTNIGGKNMVHYEMGMHDPLTVK
jgi:uncharacterized cupredoxin-like copper-binding protein